MKVQTIELEKRKAGAPRWMWAAGIMVIFCILPFFLNTSFLSLVAEILTWVVAASALNMVLGDCGLVSFGHAGFFAVGAYTFGLISYYNIASFPWAILIAIGATLIYALISGWFVVRLVEIYFALLCLAFAQVIWVVCSTWYSVTGGDDGLNGIPVPEFFLRSVSNTYYFVLIVSVICLLVMYLIRESPFGRSLHALRDNRTRAGFIGINIKFHIYIAFVISGVFCGIAGILLAVLLHCAFPEYANFIKSGEFLFVCLLGGMYNFLGPAVGAFLFVLIHFLIGRLTQYWPLVMGTCVLSIALFFRGGVVGFLADRYRDFQRKRGLQ